MNDEPFLTKPPVLGEPQFSDRATEAFKNPAKTKRSRIAKEPQYSPEYLIALAQLHDSISQKPGLTAKQQYILELVKEQVRAKTCTVDEATRRAIASADVVFGG